MKKKIETVEQYFATLSPDAKPAMNKMRETIRSAAPDAEECISYRIPAFRQNGILVYYAAFKNHISLFPANVKLVADLFTKETEKYITSKGTLQFPRDKPLPVTLIKKIVKARIKDNNERAAAKKSKKQ